MNRLERTSGGLRRGLAAALVGAMIATVVVAPVAPVLAAGPYATADTDGSAGCGGVAPVQPSDCKEWHDGLLAETQSSWQFSKELGVTVAGAAMAAKGVASINELDQSDESLGTLTLTATMEASMTGGGDGNAVIRFDAGFPVSAETISVVGSASVEGHGGFLIGGQGTVEVTVGCAEEPALDTRIQVLGGAHGGEVGRLNDDSASLPINQVIPVETHATGERFCYVRTMIAANVGANRPVPPTDHGSAKATLSLTILAAGDVPASSSPSPSPSGCALGGIVRDGNGAVDKHDNPLAGVLVELLRAGADEPEEKGVATDDSGRYCLPWDAVPLSEEGEPEPGDYTVRVKLLDALHNPPIFKTEHLDEREPIALTLGVTADDLSRTDVDLEYSATSARPWLADVANIHWQSARFIRWLVDILVVDPARLTGLSIVAYTAVGTAYLPLTKQASITTTQSPFARRDTALSVGPENTEWHEIGHHLANALGIAKLDSTACSFSSNHGGWSNDTTCDSLAEGFPVFLSTLASLDLDADRVGAGYGNSVYAGFFRLEGNDYAPWSVDVGVLGDTEYREDFAVAGLLWDLADATPDESEPMAVRARGGGDFKLHVAHDRVALGGLNVINLLGSSQPQTVVDFYDFLKSSQLVDDALRTDDVDLDGDGTLDASPIDEVFLMHNFRSFRDNNYIVGEPLAHTPPGDDGGLPDRRDAEAVPGAAIKLKNTGSGVATFTIDVKTASGATDTFKIPVAPGSDEVLDFHLPPYYEGALPESGELPACGGQDQTLVTLSISAPGTATQTADSCDYLHKVVAATDGIALTVEVAGSEPVETPVASSPPESPSPPASGGLPVALIVAVVGLLAVLAVGGYVVLTIRRRRV